MGACCQLHSDPSRVSTAASVPSFGRQRSRILHTLLSAGLASAILSAEIAAGADEVKLAAWTIGGAGVSGTTATLGHRGTLGQIGFVAHGSTNEVDLWSGYWPVAGLGSFNSLGDEVPSATQVYQPYPNPFNPGTTIEYTLSEPGYVSLAIYNVKGALVRQLVSESKGAGRYEVKWLGIDNSGRHVASGTYFCRMASGDNTSVVKMLLVK